MARKRSGIKGNDGKAARKTLVRKLSVILGVFCLVIGTVHFTGLGGKRRRERWGRTKQQQLRTSGMTGNDDAYNDATFNDPANIDSDVLDKILSASIHLVDIDINPMAMKKHDGDDGNGQDDDDQEDSSSYSVGVKGEFCKVDFDIHKKDPASVPMFRDLIAASPDCKHNRVIVDLRTITKLAREYDEKLKLKNTAEQTASSPPHAIQPTGFVFHESRCGSTLVANGLVAMNPPRHRVYSESSPPLKALKSCGEDYTQCSVGRAASLFRDVVYMMSRTDNVAETRLFFKIQSVGTKNIRVFRKAFPHTPWVFVYREPVEVMMSHLNVPKMKAANCMRSRRNPPMVIKKFVRDHGYNLNDLSPEFFCAAHLATLCEAAVEELLQSDTGMSVNYEELPDGLMDVVIPQHFGVPLSNEERRRIIEVSSKYSKARTTEDKEWKDDSERKEQNATPEIRKASEVFLQESYEILRNVKAAVESRTDRET